MWLLLVCTVRIHRLSRCPWKCCCYAIDAHPIFLRSLIGILTIQVFVPGTRCLEPSPRPHMHKTYGVTWCRYIIMTSVNRHFNKVLWKKACCVCRVPTAGWMEIVHRCTNVYIEQLASTLNKHYLAMWQHYLQINAKTNNSSSEI